ncbi:hypothetical protein HDU84_009261, partial [Entophlyctis sp. JEL0112]
MRPRFPARVRLGRALPAPAAATMPSGAAITAVFSHPRPRGAGRLPPVAHAYKNPVSFWQKYREVFPDLLRDPSDIHRHRMRFWNALPNLLFHISKSLSPPQDACTAIHSLLRNTGNMSVSTRYLRYLFYVLLFRCDASLESVWRLVEDLENEDSTSTTAHLHGQSLAILLEAELRIAHGRRIIKLSSNDLIAMKTQKYRSVFEYIQKSKMLLTVDCCRLLMREFAMFQDGVGATKLLELMRSQNVVPDSEIYQKAILAIVRKKSLTAQAVSLVEEMKAQNIKVPVPILSSMARWSFKKDFDNDYGDIVYWIERIFADNLNPNFHVLTVMVQYYFKV